MRPRRKKRSASRGRDEPGLALAARACQVAAVAARWKAGEEGEGGAASSASPASPSRRSRVPAMSYDLGGQEDEQVLGWGSARFHTARGERGGPPTELRDRRCLPCCFSLSFLLGKRPHTLQSHSNAEA